MKSFFESLLVAETLLLQKLKEASVLCPPPRGSVSYQALCKHLEAQEAIVTSIQLVIDGGDVDDLIGAYNAQIESIDMMLSSLPEDEAKSVWGTRAVILTQVARLERFKELRSEFEFKNAVDSSLLN